MAKAVTIRNVPDHVVDELSARAERGGRSLQEFLRGHLIDFAHTRDVELWLEENRLARRLKPTSFTAREIVDSVHADRR